MKIVLAALLPLMIGLNTSVSADPQALLIGGGYKLEGSQGQIELNVKWLQSLLKDRDYQLHTYYTDGDDPGVDVYLENPKPDAETLRFEPLARLFDQHIANREIIRNHTVPDVLGTTERTALEPQLRKLFQSLRAEDPLLLVYNGHGSLDTQDVQGNALKLWGDTRLSVKELHGLMRQIDTSVPQRYVFTQCYSGAFHDVIYKDLQDKNELYAGKRCGFTAESAYRQSEGCSASVEIGDYRDYTTFMFSALSGQQRDGQALQFPRVGDKPEHYTLLDAHFYTLEHAYSTDLSRSSSEYFLEQWTPWYLRWLPANAAELPQNEYARIAKAVAMREGFDPSQKGWIKALKEARALADQSLHQSLEKRKRLRKQIGTLQSTIIKSLEQRWPALERHFTAAQKHALSQESRAILRAIKEHKNYPLLKEMQDNDNKMDRLLLDTQRRTAQIDKILRMRQLARLLQQFKLYASHKEKRQYKSLVECENTPLVQSGAQ